MIVNAWGVVLARRDHSEADRLCTIYTENLGRVLVRFTGVNKPGRKLKALSEPLCWAEYRLHLSAKHDVAKAIGGQLIGTFPALRADYGRTVMALGCCELVTAITAERLPNPDKYALICEALLALDAASSPWLLPAFGLRLLELAGYGLPERMAGPDAPLWERLRELPLAELAGLPYEPAAGERARRAVYDHAQAQAGRPFKSRDFMETLYADVPAAHP